jgi:hypothetical protein
VKRGFQTVVNEEEVEMMGVEGGRERDNELMKGRVDGR